jgi:hypothetical protein
MSSQRLKDVNPKDVLVPRRSSRLLQDAPNAASSHKLVSSSNHNQTNIESSSPYLRSSRRSDASPPPVPLSLHPPPPVAPSLPSSSSALEKSPKSSGTGKLISPPPIPLPVAARSSQRLVKMNEATAKAKATAETANLLTKKRSGFTSKKSTTSKSIVTRPHTEPPKKAIIPKPLPPPPPPPYYAEDKDYVPPPWRKEAPAVRGRNGPTPKSRQETFITVLSIVGRRGFGANIVQCLFLNRQIYSFGTDYSHNGTPYLRSNLWVQEYEAKKIPIIQGYDDDEVRSLYDNPVRLRYLWRSLMNLKLGGFLETRLMRATEVNNIAEVRRLMALGASVHITDCQGETALMRSSRLNRARITKILAEKGSVNAENHDGWTALHFAASRNRGTMCKTLVTEWKANLEAQDGSLRTPLHVAAWNGCFEAAVALLDLGASQFAKSDGRGRTALAWAVRYRRAAQAVVDGKARVANLLISRGSDRYGHDVLHEQAEFYRYMRREEEIKAQLAAEPSDESNDEERTVVK